MTIEESLWRTFQSTFAKKLNNLPRQEQQNYFKIFSFRKNISSEFELWKIRQKFASFVRVKKEEKKLTRSLRKLKGDREAQRQENILKESVRILATEFFENRKMVLADLPKLILFYKKKLEGKSKGCEFYPCEPKK